MVFMKETSKSRILYLRAKKCGDQTFVEKDEVPVLKQIWRAILRPLHMCLFEVCSRLAFCYYVTDAL